MFCLNVKLFMETYCVIILFFRLRRRDEEAQERGVVEGAGRISGINISSFFT